jgi:hypothetical protein
LCSGYWRADSLADCKYKNRSLNGKHPPEERGRLGSEHGACSTAGTAVAQWLRCCATNRKVAGSIPDGVIGVFHRHDPSDRVGALGSTQTLTEMSTRIISWG